jgi:hypothetical protein
MKSPTPGLVAQMTGSHTKARYETTTIFVDYTSNLSYVHLQKLASAADTVEAKEAFERYSQQHGVAIAHYHCDNGVFTAHLWRNDCTEKRQGLSFSGVNAHHQNGCAENLQQAARTMLIHAHRQWPAAITPHLWPYAMHLANEYLNATPRIKDNDHRSLLSIFGEVEVDPNPRYWHHFGCPGCPVYVLAQPLQTSGGMFHKWHTRARVGVYLGCFLQHARSVALVLSLGTGLVSPQFHVSFDSAFQTVIPTTGEPSVPSHWQKLAGLHKETSPPEEPARPSHSKGASPLPQLDAPLPDNVEPGGFLQLENDFNYEPEVQPFSTEPPADSSTTLPNNETVTSATNSPAQPSATTVVRHNTRPLRDRHPMQRLIKTMQAVTDDQVIEQPIELLSLQAMFPGEASTLWDHPLLAYAASSDPDTLYYHEAMKADDTPEFRKAMQEEVDGQMDNGVYELMSVYLYIGCEASL